VATRYDLADTATTLTGRFQGPGMRTTYSSAGRMMPSSPRTFVKRANSLGRGAVGILLDGLHQLLGGGGGLVYPDAVATAEQRADTVLRE